MAESDSPRPRPASALLAGPSPRTIRELASAAGLQPRPPSLQTEEQLVDLSFMASNEPMPESSRRSFRYLSQAFAPNFKDTTRPPSAAEAPAPAGWAHTLSRHVLMHELPASDWAPAEQRKDSSITNPEDFAVVVSVGTSPALGPAPALGPGPAPPPAAVPPPIQRPPARRWLDRRARLPGGRVLFPLLVFFVCAGVLTVGLYVWRAAGAIESEAVGLILAARLARAVAAVESEFVMARAAADFIAREAAALGSPPSPNDPRVASLLHSALLAHPGLPAAGLVLSADGSYAAAARVAGGAARVEVLSGGSRGRLTSYTLAPSAAASDHAALDAPAGAAGPALAALRGAFAGGWTRYADAPAGRWGVLYASALPAYPSAAAFVGMDPAALSSALADANAALVLGTGDILAPSSSRGAPSLPTALAAALAPLALGTAPSEPLAALLASLPAGCADFAVGSVSVAPVPAACAALGARVALGSNPDGVPFAGRVRALVTVAAGVSAACGGVVLALAACAAGELVRSMRALRREIGGCGSFEPPSRASGGRVFPEESVNHPPTPRSILREIDSVGAALGTLQRTHAIVSAMRDAVVVVDTRHRITEFNPPAKVLFGLTHERFAGSDLGADPAHATSLVAPSDRARFAEFLALHLAAAACSPSERRRSQGGALNSEWAAFGGREAALRAIQGSASPGTGEFTAARFVGGHNGPFLFPVEVSVGQAPTARGMLQVLVMRDITERNRLLQRVKVEEARSRAVAAELARLIDTANAPVLAVDAAGRLVDWNAKMEELTGYGHGEVLGWPLASLADEDERPGLERALEDALLGAEQSGFEFSLAPSPAAAGTHRQARRRLMMSASLRRTAEGGLAGVLCIGQDITEKRRIIQVEAANAAKSRFLSYICHEIRTPLNGLLGFVHLLQLQLRDAPLADEPRDWLRSAAACSEQLLAIVSQLLDLSKIEAGKVALESAPLALRDLVDDVVDSLAPQAYRKGIEIASDVAAAVDRAGRVMGDPTRLRQILYNFLSNAIKFTERGEVVASLDVVPAAGGVAALDIAAAGGLGLGGAGAAPRHLAFRFSVRDTGVGIEPETLERLLDSEHPFFEGTGMGLSICRQLASLMGGSIDAASAPGQGSTFSFAIALELAPAPHRAPAPGAGLVTGLKPPGPHSPGGASSRRGSRVLTPPASLASLQLPPTGAAPSFLVCHSNPAIAEVVRGCVAAVPGASEEAERESVPNPAAAWARLEALAAAGCLPAYAMVDEGEGERGLALARRLATDRRFAKLRVVLMARSRRGVEVAPGHGAAVAVLLKPARLARVAGALCALAGVAAEAPEAPPSPPQMAAADGGTPSGASFYTRFSSPAARNGRSASSGPLEWPPSPAAESAFALPPPACDHEEQSPRPRSLGPGTGPELPGAVVPSSEEEAPPRVLVVDDVPMNQKVVASLLRRAGVPSDAAGDGAEAVAMASTREEPYALILMDIQMPRMDGLEATARIREGERLRPGRARSAIVALTANSILGEEQKCREAGMDQVLVKPARLEELLAALERWTRWRRPGPAASRTPT